MAMTEDDKKNQRSPNAAFQAGATVRRTLGNAVGAVRDTAAQSAAAVATPVARQLSGATSFIAGLAGDNAPGSASRRTLPMPAVQPAPQAAARAVPSARQRTPLGAPGSPSGNTPARAPAAPRAPQAPTSPVVGTFNGRSVTRAEATQRANALPTASGPVIAEGGGFAFSSGERGNQVPTFQRSLAPTQPAAPTINARTLRGDVRGAEQERQSAVRQLDSQIDRMGFGPGALNSIGERQLYAALVGERNRLTGQRVDQATTLEAQGASNESSEGIASANLQQRSSEGAADRSLTAQDMAARDEDRDAQLELSRTAVNRVLVDQQGNTAALRADGTLMPVTDAEGNPFRQQPERSLTVSPDVEFRALGDELVTLQDPLYVSQLDDAGRASLPQRVAEIRARMAALSGTGGGKTVKRRGTLNGRRVVEYTDGTTEYAD